MGILFLFGFFEHTLIPSYWYNTPTSTKLFIQVFSGAMLKSPMILFLLLNQNETRRLFKFSEWACCSYVDYKNTH